MPPSGGEGRRRIIGVPFGMEKLEWCGYLTVKNRYVFDKILMCDGRMDRQTDILRQHSPRYA